MILGHLDFHMQKNEAGILCHTIYINKTVTKNIGINLHTFKFSNRFLILYRSTSKIFFKMGKSDAIKNLKHLKRHHFKCGGATHR